MARVTSIRNAVSRTEEALGDRVIPVSRLHLDPQNPRHAPMDSDSEVIAQLCDEELIAELAQDIAARGALNPLDVLGVIPYEGHPGHFIAVEGNRRTCALILLSDPSRAPTTALQEQIKRVAAVAQIPKQVKVHVFSGRESAKPWIDLRHLGPQGGIGTREWNPDQKTRAAGTNTRTSAKANKLALEALDRLVNSGLLTPDQRSKVSLTTITRYLGTPSVRAILGLGSNSELIYTHDSSEVDAALLQLVMDSIAKQEDDRYLVHSRTNSADRLAYATSLRSRGQAPTTPLGVPAPPPDVSAPHKGSVPAKKRSTRNPALIPTLFDRSFTVTHNDPVLLRLRTEALSLKLEHYPFSGNYLLRAFVEQTMVLFAKKRGKYSPTLSDQQLTQACAEELKALAVTGKALTVINKAAGSPSHPHSLHSLGHAVHGGSIPTRQGLRAIFDTWQPSLRAMLDAL